MATPSNGYCRVEDLLIRTDLSLPSGIDAQKYINDAADEIDSKIGTLYATPVVIPTDKQIAFRTTILTLKHVNAQLATGRIIMSISSPTENSELDAYGNYLVREANAVINKIANRAIILEGAPPNTNAPTEYAVSKTHIYNLDDTSSVEAFYDIVNPSRGVTHKQLRGKFIPGEMGG